MSGFADELVDDADVGGQDEKGHARHDDPGQEVRQVNDGLVEALEGAVPHLVQHEGEQDGQREHEDEPEDVDGERVAEHDVEVAVGEQVGKMLEAHPLAAREARIGIVVLEREQQTPQRGELEQNKKQYARQREHIHRPMLDDARAKPGPIAFFLSDRQCGERLLHDPKHLVSVRWRT